MKANIKFKGGPGSGNFDHAGRPGQVGGSAAGVGVRYNLRNVHSAKALTAEVSRRMGAAGMPRVSPYTGGENTGLTNAIGSTGFSVKILKDGKLDFHVTVSGKKAGLRFESYEERQRSGDDWETMTFHRPVNPNALLGKIQKVFEGMGFKVHSVVNTGYQMMWDDDVNYNIITDTGPTYEGSSTEDPTSEQYFRQ